jgi:hypothetical protein
MASDLTTTRIDTFNPLELEKVIKGLHERYINLSPQLSWEDYLFIGLTSVGYGWFAIIMYFGAKGFDLGASQISDILSEIIKIGGPIGSAITNFFLSIAFATGADKLVFKWFQRVELAQALLAQGNYAAAILECVGAAIEAGSTSYLAFLSAIPYSALGNSIKDHWAPLASTPSQWAIIIFVMVFHLKVSNKYANKLFSHISILLEHLYVGLAMKEWLPSSIAEPLLQYWHAQQLEGIDLDMAQRVCEIVSYEHGHLNNKDLDAETIKLLNKLDTMLTAAPNTEKGYQSLNVFSTQSDIEEIALRIAALNVGRVVKQYRLRVVKQNRLEPTTTDKRGKLGIFIISVAGFCAYFRISAIDGSFAARDLMASFTTTVAFCEDSAEGFWDLLKRLWAYASSVTSETFEEYSSQGWHGRLKQKFSNIDSEAAGNPLLRDLGAARFWYGSMTVGTVLAIFSIMVTLNLTEQTMLTADELTIAEKNGVQIFMGWSTYLFNGFAFIDPVQTITAFVALCNIVGSDALRKLLLTSGALNSALAGLSHLPNDVSIYWQERLAARYESKDEELAGYATNERENKNNFLPSNSSVVSLSQLTAGGAVTLLYCYDKIDFSIVASALFFLKAASILVLPYAVSEYCKKDSSMNECDKIFKSLLQATKTACKAGGAGFSFSVIFLMYVMHYFDFNNFYIRLENGGEIPKQDEGIVSPGEALMWGSLIAGFFFVDTKTSKPNSFSRVDTYSNDSEDDATVDSMRMPFLLKS